jgi:PIN domain nuclease of toxin-antitoxin system
VIVVDTHVLVWLRSAPERLSARARAAIDAADAIAIADISLWELAMLLQRGRLAVDRPTAAYLQEVSTSVTVLPITAAVAAFVAEQAADFPGDPADRLIHATAAAAGVPLVSADRALRAADPAVVW